MGRVGNGNAQVNGNFFILGKALSEGRLGVRNSLVTVSKGVENSGFARPSQVQKARGAVTFVAPAVPLLG